MWCIPTARAERGSPAGDCSEMIDGYKQLIQEAHDRGIEVYLFTRTAWKGYTRNVLAAVQMWNGRLRSIRCARILTHGSAARTTRRTAA